MTYRDILINAIRNSVDGIDIEEVDNLFENRETFYTIKSQINNNKRKYKDIHIIKAGKNKHSIWKFAENNPKQTIQYGTKRAQRGLRTFSNRAEEINIALASELNLEVSMLLAKQVNQENLAISNVINQLGLSA